MECRNVPEESRIIGNVGNLERSGNAFTGAKAHPGSWEDVRAGDVIGWQVFSFCCGMPLGENEGRVPGGTWKCRSSGYIYPTYCPVR